jgi:hypothetical protein
MPFAFPAARRRGEIELFNLTLLPSRRRQRGVGSGLDVLAPLLLLGRRRGWGMRRFQYGSV